MVNVTAFIDTSWDVLIPVISFIDVSWNVGIAQNTHIRQLAQERIDFIY